jgi:hypothetical protein
MAHNKSFWFKENLAKCVHIPGRYCRKDQETHGPNNNNNDSPCSLLLERMRSDFLISPDTWQSLYNDLRKSRSQRNPSQASEGQWEIGINWNEFNNERQNLFEDILKNFDVLFDLAMM